MKFIILFCFLVSLTQGKVNNMEASKAMIAQMAEQVKKTNQEAIADFKQAKEQLDSALAQHDVVKRSIEQTIASMVRNVHMAPESCRQEAHQQLVELQSKSLHNYLNCTGATIFRAVGDSVNIATVSLQLFYEMFQTLDDLTHSFNNCYSSGVTYAISCTIESATMLGYDIYETVSFTKMYKANIGQMVQEVTDIIDVCHGKSKQSIQEAVTIVKNCS